MYFGTGFMKCPEKLHMRDFTQQESEVRYLHATYNQEPSSTSLIHGSELYLRKGNSRKIPDVTLIQSFYKPTLTVLVGHERTLDELFEDAKQLLLDGHVRGVFILKIHESERPAPVKPPWYMSMDKKSQIDELLAYHRTLNIPLVGKLSVDLYLWSCERSPFPPRYPLWSFQCGHDTPEQPGTFNNVDNPLLDTNNCLKILGRSYALPMETLQDDLRMEIQVEEYHRAFHCIYGNNFSSETQE